MEKKFLSMLLALIMLLSLLPTMAFAATKSGTGWSFDTETGTLTISGELESAHPWIDAGVDAAQIISVVTKDGAKAPEDSSYMFYYLDNLKSADLSKLDTSNVEYMWFMFAYCSSLTTLDVSGFDTSKVTSMGSMFAECWSLKTLDVIGFDTSKVTNMGEMFAYCGSLTTLDVSGFDTSNVEHMNIMFYKCGGLTKIVLPANFYKGDGSTCLFDISSAWYDDNGNEYTDESDLVSNKAVTLYIDKPPVITVEKTTLEAGTELTAANLGAAAMDADGTTDLTNKITVKCDDYDANTPGTYTVILSVKDKDNKVGITKEITVTVEESHKPAPTEVKIAGSDGKTVENEDVIKVAENVIADVKTQVTALNGFNAGENNASVPAVLGSNGYVDVKLTGVNFAEKAASTVDTTEITTFVFDVTPYTVTGGTATEQHTLDAEVTFRLPLVSTDYKYADVSHEGEFLEQVELASGDTYIELSAKDFSEYSYTLTNTKYTDAKKHHHNSSSAPAGHTMLTDLSDITAVYVDGKKLDSKYYTISGGNVTLTQEFLNTLSAGTHTFKAENATHIATGTFTVEKDAATSPKTADAGIAVYGVLSVMSLMGMGWVSKKKSR